METIKRYQNRKLYSTKISKYVTMEYILDLVRSRESFQVFDNKTKTDITKKTIKASLTELPMSLELMTTIIRGN